MKRVHKDDWLTVWQGDCREVMAAMEPESVHCVVTSPPYWGLRDYGTATWLGGDEGCDHIGSQMRTAPPGTEKQASNFGSLSVRAGDCKCGAVRQDSQLGLEPTPEEYVANMVAVFREVRRVLRRDGTCWVNLGDSYSQSANTGGTASIQGSAKRVGAMNAHTRPIPDGLKPKDLVGIPWRVAFALQADGWYLRSDIIWSKPNPMPESVTDRPTKAHEYVFLLSKSPRYYYDADAVREDSIYQPGDREDVERGGFGGKWADTPGKEAFRSIGSGRNLRSVWSIATQPYPGAHFATFPEKLVEPCVKAGTSERGVCPECGAPWRRVVERVAAVPQRENYHGDGILERHRGGAGQVGGFYPESGRTLWQPTCEHGTGVATQLREGSRMIGVPATVLDPFAGSGTTGRVAQRLGRRAVLIDLSGEYLTQAMRRNQEIPLSLSFSPPTAGRVADPDDEPSTDAA